MTLIRELSQSPLDPAYYAATQRRHKQNYAVSGKRRLLIALSFIVLVVCAGVTTIAIDRLLQPAPDADQVRSGLESQIKQRVAHLEQSQEQLSALREQIDAFDQAPGDSQVRGDNIQRMAVLAATTPLTGRGVVQQLDDAPPSVDAQAADSGRIKDTDLQYVVNSWWSSGASAISISGMTVSGEQAADQQVQRLTSASAIRTAGGAINVGYQPLLAPYTITVMSADPHRLVQRFESSNGARLLTALNQDFGVTTTLSAPHEVSMPGTNEPTVRFASQTPSTTEAGQP